ncbi:hypothetical protein SERLA73DRAFT_70645 [Serpula lacrymans var. lacrymans S7.3]|uniref:Uncharacterized protein n=2 Tax=Serpula lacrymans var. lacrymans TaxID=341189 RepID=F8PPU2_SERL3|nr:uncharacterized protein SERLADRAFT_413646 [Serpula lacrymans var. lacrymans S7.9]EGO01459.1 hypothetical protein SERLA73DRAFT_70645 [Serpula lacrymans var. lacrymans S7.3]EGO27123.1 hypothetical protein SERLADRAFT_413646 [Serpula lacrymans var. lacrymans S7.9]
MMQLILLSLVTLFLVLGSWAAPSNGEPYLSSRVRLASAGSLTKRQSGSVPEQCTNICDPINSVVASDPSPIMYCSQSFENGYYNCTLCVGTAVNATDYSVAQKDLDNVYLTCLYSGYPLEELTLPGQNPNRTLTTSFASVAPQTSLTAPASQTTALTSSGSTSASASKTSSTPATTTTAGARILSPNIFWAGLAITLGWITLTIQ